MKAVLPLFLTSLTCASLAQANQPSVAVDIAPVHSLVSQVMGDLGSPDLIVSQGASPHGYSLRPSEAQALQNADIVFWVSHRLTPWLDSAIETLAPDATQIELLEIPGITELMQREGALFEAHDHGHGEEEGEHHDGHDEDEGEHHDGHDEEEGESHDEHGDDAEKHEDDEHDSGKGEHHDDDDHEEHAHSGVDPHAWLDPANAAVWLDAIAKQLSEFDPANAGTYTANAATGKVRLEQLKGEVGEILDPVSDKHFIVFHDAYQYFENAFDFPASGAISVGDATQPGPARIQQIQKRVADAGVSCVLSEPQFNPGLVATVLDGSEAASGVVDPHGFHLELGSELYPALLLELAESLADCL